MSIRFRKNAGFAERFARFAMPVPFSGCYIWTGNVTDRGYGFFQRGIGDGKKVRILAHRASYETFAGAIPAGMFVCHKCDTPSCVNPQHLFLGTPADNSRDMVSKARTNPLRGEKHQNAKITEDDVRSIRESLMPYSQMAAKYGLSLAAIHNIKHRKSWGHVT